jgi:hypothetical protein
VTPINNQVIELPVVVGIPLLLYTLLIDELFACTGFIIYYYYSYYIHALLLFIIVITALCLFET